MKPTNDRIRQELEAIRKSNPTGRLEAEDVVQAAVVDDHPLHEFFCWDDGEAARLYRIEQARGLIQMVVVEMPRPGDGKPVAVRFYHSLDQDRRRGGGYRNITEITAQPDLWASLLAEAQTDLNRWAQRYRQLESITAPVQAAMDKAVGQYRRQANKGKGRPKRA